MQKLYRNFLEQNYVERISSLVLSPDFPWYYTPSTNNDDDSNSHCFIDDKTIETPQFIHTVYIDNTINSDMFYELEPLFRYFDITEDRLLRCKFNLLTKNYNYPDGCYQTAHQDAINAKSLLFYLNDADGDTLFFNSRYGIISNRFSPERGSAVLFDSHDWHTSTPPKKCKQRIVINVIFEGLTNEF